MHPAPGFAIHGARGLHAHRGALGRYVVGANDRAGTRVPPNRAAPVEAVAARLAPTRPVRGARCTLRVVHAGADTDADAGFASPSYALVDVRGGWEGARVAGLEFAPFAGVTNLLDRGYNTSVVINAFGGRYYEPGPGRSLYAGLRMQLGAPRR